MVKVARLNRFFKQTDIEEGFEKSRRVLRMSTYRGLETRIDVFDFVSVEDRRYSRL